MNRATRPSRPGLTGSASKSLLLSAAAGGVVLKAGPDTTTSTSLSWRQPDYKPDNYRVERSLDGSSFSTVATVSDSTLDYNDTGLTESTQYWYSVVPILGGVDQPASNVASTWTVPSTPTTLTATAVGGTQIDLTWVDVSTGNTGQIIERRTPSGSGSYSLLATVSATATTYSDTGLTPGQSYEYRVAATNPATLSAYSNTASATPSATPTAAWTLDFSSGEPWANGTNYTFSSTASTSRTFVNSSGYVAPCGANLCLRSEDFTNATWRKSQCSVTGNSSTAPDNTSTADLITENSANDAHGVDTATINSQGSGNTICFSVYAKKPSSNGRDCVGLAMELQGGGYCGRRFDLTNGTNVGADYNTNTTNLTNLTYGIENAGSGWYRCWVSVRINTSGNFDYRISPCVNSTTPFKFGLCDYQGDNTSGILVWGAQVVTGTAPLPYSATTTSSNGIPRLTHNSSGSRLGLLVEGQRTNSLQRSEQIDNAYWTKDGTTCTGASIDAIAAPDNTTTADLILETATTAYHAVYRDVSGFTNNTAKVMSAFVKKQNRSQIDMHLTNGVGSIRQLFDIDAGATVGAINNGIAGSTGVESGIESFGNGWFRIWLTAANIGTNCNILLFLSNTTGQTEPNRDADSRPSYAGNTSNGAYVWGCMIEDNATRPSSYIPTTTASVTRSSDLVHVLDSSITSWGDPGALVVHFYPPGQAGTLISTDDAATAQVGIEASTTTAARAFWSSGSTATGTIGTGVQKAVHYWNGSSSKFCINGGTVQSGTNNFTIANADFVTLGAEATDSAGVPGTFSQYANCVIRKVEFYSGTLTDGNLQTITT